MTSGTGRGLTALETGSLRNAPAIVMLFLSGLFLAGCSGDSASSSPVLGQDEPVGALTATSPAVTSSAAAVRTSVLPNLDPAGIRSYTWVLVVEINALGGPFTAVMKLDGLFIAPDRRRERAGGVTTSREQWMSTFVAIGPDGWLRTGLGANQAWMAVPSMELGHSRQSYLPYWDLFVIESNALNTQVPVREKLDQDDALHYKLELKALPFLQDYLFENLVFQGLSAASRDFPGFSTAVVDYWLRESEGRPLRLSIYPAQELLPAAFVSFNISVIFVDNPAIRIEAPTVP